MIGALAGMAIVLGSAQFGGAYANDDDNELPDTKFFRSLLKGLGLRSADDSGIEYRERSPLVLPPGRDLPAPARDSATPRVADWPKDPDIERARQARANRNKPNPDVSELSRPLYPDELNVPGPARRTSRTDTTPRRSAEEQQQPMSPYDLGSKNPLSSIWASKEEYTTFTREPPRGSLTEPPSGYRTPSPNQPYGLGKEKWTDKPRDQHVPVR